LRRRQRECGNQRGHAPHDCGLTGHRAPPTFAVARARHHTYKRPGLARSDLPPPEGEIALKELNLLAVDYDALEKDAPAIKRKFNGVFQ
jgi:hypothetical protein